MHQLKIHIAILLMLVFIFPTLSKFVHEFEHHHEDECHDKTTHICEDEHGCAICEFTFSAFTQADDKGELTLSKEILKPFRKKASTKKSRTPLLLSLRGPPSVS